MGYDYDNLRDLDGSMLDLIAQIPDGTTLVEGSVQQWSTKGSADPVQSVISADSITLDLKDHIAGAAGVLTYQVRVDSPLLREKISAGADLKLGSNFYAFRLY
ncbi:MAG TPA: hypothetical protein GXX46_06045 [Peptococcaceae bacterium]|nr:hypothetical protein [Peptococcaceae bacterium]